MRIVEKGKGRRGTGKQKAQRRKPAALQTATTTKEERTQGMEEKSCDTRRHFQGTE